jgi:hypothetical protein
VKLIELSGPKKKGGIPKDKINELQTNSKNKNIRELCINKFKKGYQPRNKLVEVENGDLLTDFHSILNRWKNYFFQIFSVHGVNDVRHIEIHTAETLVA